MVLPLHVTNHPWSFASAFISNWDGSQFVLFIGITLGILKASNAQATPPEHIKSEFMWVESSTSSFKNFPSDCSVQSLLRSSELVLLLEVWYKDQKHWHYLRIY